MNLSSCRQKEIAILYFRRHGIDLKVDHVNKTIDIDSPVDSRKEDYHKEKLKEFRNASLQNEVDFLTFENQFMVDCTRFMFSSKKNNMYKLILVTSIFKGCDLNE